MSIVTKDMPITEEEINTELAKSWKNVKVRITAVCYVFTDTTDPSRELHLQKQQEKLPATLPEAVQAIGRVLAESFRNCTSLTGYGVRDPRTFFFTAPTTWKNKLLGDNFALNIFTREINMHPNGEHAEIVYTEPFSGEVVMLFVRKVGNKTELCTGNEYEFHEMVHGGHRTISLSYNEDIRVHLSKVRSELHIPESMAKGNVFRGNGIVTVDVLEQTHNRVSVEYHAFYTKSVDLNKVSKIYTAYINDTGEPILEEKDIDHPEWLTALRTAQDLEKNPHNTQVHHMLVDQPLYQVEDTNVFITSSESVYINTEYGWLEIEGGMDRIENSNGYVSERLKHICKEVRLMQKLQH